MRILVDENIPRTAIMSVKSFKLEHGCYSHQVMLARSPSICFHGKSRIVDNAIMNASPAVMATSK